MALNICIEIKCPFANAKKTERAPHRSTGCSLYGTSQHCHLRAEFPELKGMDSEYWIHKDVDGARIAEIKEFNDEYVQTDERSQQKLETEVKFGERASVDSVDYL